MVLNFITIICSLVSIRNNKLQGVVFETKNIYATWKIEVGQIEI